MESIHMSMKESKRRLGDGQARSPARVLVVDDHPIARRGLIDLLEGELGLEIAGEASDGASALALLESKHPDLVLIDISLQGANGIDLIKEIRSRDEGVRMLVASMHDEAIYADRALRAGAMGYINKEAPVAQFLEAVNQVLDGNLYLSQGSSEAALRRTAGVTGQPRRSPLERLSDRELEVFSLIGDGLTTREIAIRLGLSPKTVETHRENIKDKLDLKNATQLVSSAVRWRAEND
jgi:DNA-binding NarL/FixJ family response regulator